MGVAESFEVLRRPIPAAADGPAHPVSADATVHRHGQPGDHQFGDGGRHRSGVRSGCSAPVAVPAVQPTRRPAGHRSAARAPNIGRNIAPESPISRDVWLSLTFERGPVANLMACLTVDEPEGRLIDVELDGDELARLLAGETVTVASR
jgi:hypothetical protein